MSELIWHNRKYLEVPCDVCKARPGEKCKDMTAYVEIEKAGYTRGFSDGEKYGVDGLAATLVHWIRTDYATIPDAQMLADAIEKRKWMKG